MPAQLNTVGAHRRERANGQSDIWNWRCAYFLSYTAFASSNAGQYAHSCENLAGHAARLPCSLLKAVANHEIFHLVVLSTIILALVI